MKIKKYNLNNKKVKYLIDSDESLGKLIKNIKSCSLSIEEDGFKCIVKYIIGQQISDKTRESIWNKLCENYGDIYPQVMLETSELELRNIGICRQKITYIKNLSLAVLNNQINFKNFKKLTNDEIIKKLTKIKGIGKWTAEMYLIFSLGRENVLSRGDNTIKRLIKWLYNLEKLPSSKELDEYFSNWMEYSTIVSVYFWEAIARGITKNNIDDLK